MVENAKSRAYNISVENVSGNVFENLSEGVASVTIKDIARESGYAISTVSRALNDHPDVSEEAKARIRQVVEARGFVPNANARKLKQTEAKTIVFLVKSTANMFFAGMLVQLQQLVSRASIDGVVQYLDEDGDEVVLAQRLSRERKPRGIIFLGGSAASISAKGFPPSAFPACWQRWSARSWSSITSPWLAWMTARPAPPAIDHLLANGHKDILILGADPAYSNPSYKRLQGCNDSFTAHGMELAPRRYLKTSFSFSAAYQAMDAWLKEGQRPQAVRAMSDTTAIGAIRALNDHGLRVPGGCVGDRLRRRGAGRLLHAAAVHHASALRAHCSGQCGTAAGLHRKKAAGPHPHAGGGAGVR